MGDTLVTYREEERGCKQLEILSGGRLVSVSKHHTSVDKTQQACSLIHHTNIHRMQSPCTALLPDVIEQGSYKTDGGGRFLNNWLSSISPSSTHTPPPSQSHSYGLLKQCDLWINQDGYVCLHLSEAVLCFYACVYLLLKKSVHTPTKWDSCPMWGDKAEPVQVSEAF